MTSRIDPPRRLPWDGRRDPAVDLLRGAAVIFMIIAHVRVWAPVPPGAASLVIGLVNTVASPLFAVVMGVSAGIVLTRTRHRVAGAAFVIRNVVRGIILVLIGVGLESLDTFVAIVLMSLGATLAVSAPLALLPLPVLAATALLTFVLGPPVNVAVRARVDAGRLYSDAWGDQVLQWFVLSPHYRVVSLLPFVLIGVVLARTGLRRSGAWAMVAAGLVSGGLLVALELGGFLADGAPRGGWVDLLIDLALTGCVFGVIVLFARSPRMSGVVTALEPVRAVGATALTAYVLHVVLIALVIASVDTLSMGSLWPLPVVGVFVATVLACWVWWRVIGRGPVERVMALATDPIG